MNEIGLYGKLPSHGDFIQRNLPAVFIHEWDTWLQHYVSGAKEKIGEDWLDIYLTSPIWRFVLSHGVIDENHWAGILMPSVDQVGRYFPFTIAMKLPQDINPLEFVSLHTGWYSELEDLALAALDGDFLADELQSELSGVELILDSSYVPKGELLDSYALHIELELVEQSASSIYPHFLDAILHKILSSYSTWTTLGSERVAPCLFSVQNLPSVARLPAMLDGDWRKWGWHQPYTLNTEAISV